jgi:hypothetical protein
MHILSKGFAICAAGLVATFLPVHSGAQSPPSIESRPVATSGSLVSLPSVTGGSVMESLIVGDDTADALSGSWGSDGETFLDLKFDGRNGVSGTAFWRVDGREVSRGPIAKGTFDKKTGRLRLEGETTRPEGGKLAAYVIEGKIDGKTLAGTYRLDDHKGTFEFVKLDRR